MQLCVDTFRDVDFSPLQEPVEPPVEPLVEPLVEPPVEPSVEPPVDRHEDPEVRSQPEAPNNIPFTGAQEEQSAENLPPLRRPSEYLRRRCPLCFGGKHRAAETE